MDSCKACGIFKDSENTWVSKTTGRFHSYCRSCQSDIQKQYRLANKEKAKAYQKEYYKENKNHLINQMMKWQKENPDARKEYAKRWRLRHPARNVHYSARYRASKLQATPSWLTEDNWNTIKYKYLLARDASTLTGEPYHVDHIVPLLGGNVCGLHVPWNLQVLPADINISKSNKTELEEGS